MTCNCNHAKHPHTVGAPSVPLYLLGQDTFLPPPDTTFIPPADMVPPPIDLSVIPGSSFSPSLPVPVDPLIASGFSPTDAATIADLAGKGWLNQQDWSDLFSGNVTASELAKINYDASYAQEAAQAAGIVKAAAGATSAVVKAATSTGTQPVALPPGSSPRVGVKPAVAPGSGGGGWFSGSTSIGGAHIPNVALIAGAALGAVMLMGGSRGRRR